MLELSYRHDFENEDSLTGFAALEHVNSMIETEGSVSRDDRYNQLFTSVGLMWTWQTAMYLKGLYTLRSTSLAGLPDISMYRVALGFDFQGFSF
jgi:hypothetical protein